MEKEEEKSAGAVVFRKENSTIKYLLLHYPGGHWGFPKGNIEKGETEGETIEREIEEETGIGRVEIIPGFRERIQYFYRRQGKLIRKVVIFLLAETEQEEVEVSHEHQDFEWLEYEEALERITFENAKNIIRKAEHFLKSSLRRF